MRLMCDTGRHSQIRIAPAAVRRDWMDKTQQRSAYRCLPLNIANAHGWVILNGVPIMVEWNGADGVDAITIKSLDDSASQTAASIFGSGVLTFPVDGLFRTDPGYDLMVMGPANAPKDAIQPLTGIVETDWSPFPFTMNWKFTRPHAPVTFERDEPICMIFPMARGLVEAVEPEFRLFENEPQSWNRFRIGLKAGTSSFRTSRWRVPPRRPNNGKKITLMAAADLQLPRTITEPRFRSGRFVT